MNKKQMQQAMITAGIEAQKEQNELLERYEDMNKLHPETRKLFNEKFTSDEFHTRTITNWADDYLIFIADAETRAGERVIDWVEREVIGEDEPKTEIAFFGMLTDAEKRNELRAKQRKALADKEKV